MGWCPYAKVKEAKRPVSFESLDLNIPNRANGEGGDTKSLGWFRKASTRILLLDIFLTFVYFLIFIQIGINLIFLLAGLFIVLFHFTLYWKTQIKKYDALVKHPVVEYSNKMIIVSFAIIFMLYFLRFFLDIAVSQELAWQATLSLCGGLLVGMWLNYFQIKYWEKMNHKTIYVNKYAGMRKTSYVIQEEK
jgi:hypothetical protein